MWSTWVLVHFAIETWLILGLFDLEEFVLWATSVTIFLAPLCVQPQISKMIRIWRSGRLLTERNFTFLFHILQEKDENVLFMMFSFYLFFQTFFFSQLPNNARLFFALGHPLHSLLIFLTDSLWKHQVSGWTDLTAAYGVKYSGSKDKRHTSEWIVHWKAWISPKALGSCCLLPGVHSLSVPLPLT